MAHMAAERLAGGDLAERVPPQERLATLAAMEPD